MRAYSELESDGLVTTRRGGGTAVAKTPPTVSPEEGQRALDEQAAAFVAHVRLLGVTDEAVGTAVQRALDNHVSGSDPQVERDTRR